VELVVHNDDQQVKLELFVHNRFTRDIRVGVIKLGTPLMSTDEAWQAM
jgi:hypothetical protein